MSKEKNNKDEDFDAFLNEAGKSDAFEGDFEKDAEDGFDLLDSDEQKEDLKKSLDARVYAEVFSENKSEKRVSYWLPAAAILLVVGFSIFLINDAYRGTIESNNMALSTDPVNKPIPEFRNSDQKVDASVTPSLNEALKTVPQEPISEQKKNIVSELQIAKSQKPEKELKVNDDFSREDLAMTDQKLDENQSTFESSKDNTAPLSSGATVPPIIETQVAATNRAANAPPSSAMEFSSQLEVYDKKLSDKETNIAVVKTSRGTSKAKENTENCFYIGGEEQLQIDLRKKLSEKNIQLTFESIVEVNKKGAVESVKIISSDSLTSNEKTAISEVLKTLDKFDFKDKKNLPRKSPYKIKYNP